MSAEPGFCRFATERVHLPPMSCAATFYWDGMGATSQALGSNVDCEPDLVDPLVTHSLTHASGQAQCQTSTAGNLCLVPSCT